MTFKKSLTIIGLNMAKAKKAAPKKAAAKKAAPKKAVAKKAAPKKAAAKKAAPKKAVAKKAAPKKAVAKKAAPKKAVAKKAVAKKAAPKKAVAPKALPKLKAAKKPMTKGEIVDVLAGRLGTTKKMATQFLEDLVTLAHLNAKKGFTIPGLGKLSTATRKARKGRNPQTGEALKIPAKKVVKFKVAKAAQDAVFPPKKK